MTRKAFLKKYLLRFSVSLTLLGLIVYTVYHVFASSSESLMKTSIRSHTEYASISGKAYLFRDEEVLTSPREGLVNDLAPNGTKISRGVALAEVWECPAHLCADNQIRLDDLNHLISVLEASKVPAGTPLSQAGGYRNEAVANYEALLAAVAQGNWSLVRELESDFLTLLNQYATLTGPDSGLEETLAELKSQRAALLTGTPLTLKNDKASGYYYDRGFVDGYESIFTLDKLNGLTAEGFAALTQADPVFPADSFTVGKTVYSYEWSIAIALDSADASHLSEGESYSFRFPENRDRELTLTCTRLIPTDGGSVAIFTSSQQLADFTYLRVQTAVITVDSCSGYYVPDSAIYTVDGVEGVYAFRDGTARFLPINVLYRGDGYCIIAEENDGGENSPVLYEVLITSGRNLYDGRVYK